LADTRIFFVSDLHGSEVCFRKFVNAAQAYRADVIIAGGDVTGKVVVPLVDGGDGAVRARYLGSDLTLRTEEEVRELEKSIRNVGFYPVRMSQEEVASMDATSVDALFARETRRVLESWMRLAEERLARSGIPCYMMPGNDDLFEIDTILDEAGYVVNVEGQVVPVGPLEMISTGWANMTPWRCPRDTSEEDLAARIESLVARLEDPRRAIFNLHCPPHNSTLDSAPELDETLTPKLAVGGEMRMVPVGSTAVRAAIERYQPALGLHGHIHESRGATRIGRSLCINPGSDYQQGTLRGAIVVVSAKGDIRDWALTAG
jgi:Icc-related predicted phosphoesterase